jgi:hypothetical protein
METISKMIGSRISGEKYRLWKINRMTCTVTKG